MSEIASRTGTGLSIFSFCGPVALVDRTKNGDTSIKLKGYLGWLYLCALFAIPFISFFLSLLSKTPLFFITLPFFLLPLSFCLGCVVLFFFFLLFTTIFILANSFGFVLSLSFLSTFVNFACCRNILIVRWCQRQTTTCSACVQCVSDVSEYKKPAFETVSNILMSIRQSYRMSFSLSFHSSSATTMSHLLCLFTVFGVILMSVVVLVFNIS